MHFTRVSHAGSSHYTRMCLAPSYKALLCPWKDSTWTLLSSDGIQLLVGYATKVIRATP